jgi:LmbE family N-acetylglucosaminyl deacetylase
VNILICSSHPDDAELGMGGTISKLVSQGHEVSVLTFTDGVSARPFPSIDDLNVAQKTRRQAYFEAGKLLGYTPLFPVWNYRDNAMDTDSLLSITEEINKVIAEVQPERVFTHTEHCLNIDHKIVHDAVLVATRPGLTSVREVYAFEVPSSTEWNFPNKFSPNVFEDISIGVYNDMASGQTLSALSMKICALKCYDAELRKFPHPRSEEAIRVLAAWRGATAGVNAAEAFQLVRSIR